MKTLRLCTLGFLAGYVIVALGVSQVQFLWQAYHHGGW